MADAVNIAILSQHSIPNAAKKEGMYLRRIIRRNKGGILTNSEVSVLVAVLNLWLYHRNGPKGFIHPGCDLLAKKTKVSRKTVSRSLDIFRKIGIADDINHIKGGNGRATQYRVDTVQIQALFDPSNVVEMRGEIVPFSGTFRGKNVPLEPGQNVPLSIERERTSQSQTENGFEGGAQ